MTEFISRKYGNDGFEVIIKTDDRNHYKAAEDFARKLIDHGKPEWIPVTERLPELHTKVLCCGVKGGRFIAELGTWGYEKHLYWDKKNGRGCPEVTHWMPLPEAPKEVE